MSVIFRFLLDENLPPWLGPLILREVPLVEVCHVGDGEAPPKGTLDPDILHWCQRNGYLLVTNNRSTMPTHLVDHLEAGLHCPGILVFHGIVDTRLMVETLTLIATAGDVEEWRDQVSYLPL